MYVLYTAVLGFGFLRRSTFCIHAVVHAVYPCTYVQDDRYAGFAGAKAGHVKILINRGALKFSIVKSNAGLWSYNPDIPCQKYFQEMVLRT